MFDFAIFLDTPTFNPDDFDISDEILQAMLEPIFMRLFNIFWDR